MQEPRAPGGDLGDFVPLSVGDKDQGLLLESLSAADLAIVEDIERTYQSKVNRVGILVTACGMQ